MVVLGIVIAVALSIRFAGELVTFYALKVVREDHKQRRQPMSRAQLRRLDAQFAALMLATFAYLAIFVIQPFGERDTFLYVLIIPFLVLIPVGTVALVVITQRRGRPHS